MDAEFSLLQYFPLKYKLSQALKYKYALTKSVIFMRFFIIFMRNLLEMVIIDASLISFHDFHHENLKYYIKIQYMAAKKGNYNQESQISR